MSPRLSRYYALSARRASNHYATASGTTRREESNSISRSLLEYSNDRWNLDVHSHDVQTILATNRKCVALGRHFPRDLMTRFVLARHEREENQRTETWIVPDVHKKLKGKGAYVSSKAIAIEIAKKKKAFQFVFQRMDIKIPDDLVDFVRKELRQHALNTFLNCLMKTSSVERVTLACKEQQARDKKRDDLKTRLAAPSLSNSSEISVLETIKKKIDARASRQNERALDSPKLWTIIPAEQRRENKVKDSKDNDDDDADGDDGVVFVESLETNKLEKSYACDLFSINEIVDALQKKQNGGSEIVRRILDNLKKEDDTAKISFVAIRGMPEKESFNVRMSLTRSRDFDAP